MKIAVLMKQVPVSNNVSVDPDTHALIRSSSEGMINPADLNAIEAGIILREKYEGEVVAFTMGPQDAEKSLRDALAIGCDEACLITDRALAGGDTIATAKTLAKAIEIYGEFDLIMSGALSTDGATGQVGAMVAEYLQLPHVSEINGVDFADESFQITKKFQNNIVELSCEGPASVSVCFGVNSPRLATLRTKRAAKNKEITVYTNRELQLAEQEVGIAGSPTLVVDSFAPEYQKKAKMLLGTPEEIAEQMKELISIERGKN